MSKGLISFDLDGVLANFTRGFTRIANRIYGTPVGDGQSQQNWMFEDFPELGLTKKMCDFTRGPIWNEIKSSPSFWADLDPFNPSVMHRINRIKNKIFITNRMGVDPYAQSREFLRRWGVDEHRIVVASKKAPIAIAENVVAHVDDYYPNCVDLIDGAPNVEFVALHYAPYNRLHHADWMVDACPKRIITLSVEHFIDECEKRGYVEYSS